MAIEVNRIFGFNVHSLTIRRWLSKFWRRASPTLHIKDPDKEAKLARIKEALARCDADNPVFYEDEVDIHSPPPKKKIGADWMPKGQQKKVVTSGYYPAGALHAKTFKVSYVGSSSRNCLLRCWSS